jgi:hypothetical protein
MTDTQGMREKWSQWLHVMNDPCGVHDDLIEALDVIDRFERQADLRISMIANLASDLVKAEEKIEKVGAAVEHYYDEDPAVHLRRSIREILDADDD